MVLGIDSGEMGGIVGLDNSQIVFKHIMPFKNEYKIDRLRDILLELKPEIELVGVESVLPIFGVKSSTTFKMGGGLYLIYGVLTSLYIPYITVTAKKWQDFVRINEDLCFKGVTPKKKLPKLDSKCTALNCANRLFPNVDFRGTKRSTEPHTGIVDAALISYYTEQNYKTI